MSEYPPPPVPTQDWTPEAVRPGKVYPRNEYGKVLQAFYVDFRGQDGFRAKGTYWKRGEGNVPPVGEPLSGTISVGDLGYRFKLDQGQGRPRKMDFGGTARESKGWKPREPRSQYDPEDMARQTRSAAQDRALKALGMGSLGKGNLEDWDEAKVAITEWTKWFEDQVIEAGEAAAQAQGIATASSESAAPPSRAPLGSEQPPANQGGDASANSQSEGRQRVAEGVSMNFGTPSEQDEHRMDDALYNAGINDFDERRWLTEAWRNLPDDRRKACLGGLISGDIETPPKTLKGLKKEAGPMPDSFRTNHDPLPF